MAAATSGLSSLSSAVPIVGGLLNTIFGGLFAAHAQRAKDATSENAAVNELVAGFDQGIKGIFDAANTGKITAAQALTELQQLSQWFWTAAPQFQGKPGTAMRSGGCANQFTPAPPMAKLDGSTCDKGCTALCCVGCNIIDASIANAEYVFQSGGGTAFIAEVVGNAKYGSNTRPAYSLTYTSPGTVASVENSLASTFGLSSTSGSSSSSTLLIAGLAGVGLLLAYAFSGKR